MKRALFNGILALATVTLTSTFASAAEHRIAVVMGMTGLDAFVAVPATNAMKLAEEDLRAEKFFGKDTLKVTYLDHRSDKHEAITLLNRVAQDPANLMMLGPVASSTGLAVAPAAVALKIPIFATSTSPAVLAAGEWAFKVSENAETYVKPISEYIGKIVKPKSCYLVSDRGNEAYLLYSKVFKENILPLGVKIAAEDTFLSNESNFSALATKIVASGADCLYISTPPESGANLVVQARQAGMPANTVIVGNQNMSSEKYTGIGGRAVDGTYIQADFSTYTDLPEAKEFIRKYRERYGVTPDSWAAVGYSMMRIVAHAIKGAGPNPTRDKLRAALAASKEVPVLIGSGKFSLDKDRVPHFGAVVLQIRDGKVMLPVHR